MESIEVVLQRLGKVRKTLKLTQDEVTEVVNINRSALSKIENGTQEAGALELIMFYNREYNVPVDLVFNFETPIEKGNTLSRIKIRGDSSVLAGGNVTGSNNSVIDQECRQKLEEMTKDRDIWKDKYIAVLEELRMKQNDS